MTPREWVEKMIKTPPATNNIRNCIFSNGGITSGTQPMTERDAMHLAALVWDVEPWGYEVEMMSIYVKGYFHGTLACDGKCHKAWGICNRPKKQLSDDEDDYESLADHELDNAPENPGTYEGGCGKPSDPSGINKWCHRECERSNFIRQGRAIELPDFSKRVRNRNT